MIRRVNLLVVVAALVLLEAALLGAGVMEARASGVTTVRHVGPMVCHPVHCSQERTVTKYVHGQEPTTLLQIRRRPAESRSLVKGHEAWTHWRTIGVR